MKTITAGLILALAAATAAAGRRWANGPPTDPDFFPVSVWLQDPANAAAYKAIGVNLYVGLWRGPTGQQLADLAAAQMPVIADFRRSALESPHARQIVGWMLMDEPDNAQAKRGGGWGPCVLPPVIQQQYRERTSADPARPVYLNLGQAIVNEKWPGRGEACGGHFEHYAEYARGADIVSYDVYPVNNKLPLWYVGEGVERLRKWSDYRKPVWNWIETTSISGGPKPSPADIKSEVWMSIIHGSTGIGYFCHQFKPEEDSARPLHDEQTRQTLAAINAQIHSLAQVLNSPTIADGVNTASSNAASPVETLLKRHRGATYLFAIGARPGGETAAEFRLRGMGGATAEVLGESRSLPVKNGVLRDRFTDYQVHIYRIR